MRFLTIVSLMRRAQSASFAMPVGRPEYDMSGLEKYGMRTPPQL